MLANPNEGVDTIGTFSALDHSNDQATDEPADATVTSAETTVNPETTDQTAPEPAIGLAPSDEAPDNSGNPETRTFKAKLDGKEIEFFVNDPDVDVDQLPTSLMMTNTFYKKTEELANERKVFEEKSREFDASLEDLRSQLDYESSQFESKEMQALKEDDPSAYWEKYGELKTKHDKFKAFTEKRQAEINKAHSDLVNSELKNWEVTIPEWQDAETKKKESGELYKFLVDEGFSPEMVGGIYDSRLVKHLRQSMLYKKASSKSIQSTKSPAKHVKSNSTAKAKPKPDQTLESIFYGS
jgi:hypothetical protein